MQSAQNGSLTRILQKAADEHAVRLAIWDMGHSTTYGELFGRAEQLAQQIDRVVPPGLAVGLLLPRSLNSFIGLLAALLSHRAYVPLNPDIPLSRLQSICSAAKPGAILCCDETRNTGAALLVQLPRPSRLFDMDGRIVAEGAVENCDLATAYSDTAYIIFTSGTTGEPKGVRVTQDNVAAYLAGISPIVGLGPEDRASQFVDHHFDLSVHDIFVGLTSGAELSILPRHRAMETMEFTRERELTAWCSVPSLVAFCDRLGQLLPTSLPSLRLSVFCGEALPVRLAEVFAEAAPNMRIVNMYGPTEATVALTAYEIKNFAALKGQAMVPLGWPFGDQVWEIGTGDGEPGEIILGGSQVTSGYINSPEQNAAKFFTDSTGVRHYRTGDLGQLSEEFGGIYLGRMDDQVKVNGYRIELLEIDAALANAAGTSQVAAVAWPINEDGRAESIIGFVVGSKRGVAEIRAACRDLLPSYMLPRRIVALDEMPLSINGKIDRKRLTTMC